MFVVLLRFSSRRDQAAAHMAGHNEWLRCGVDDGVFLLAGSLQPGLGGAILAHGVPHDELLQRVQADPFVAAGVVEPEILEISPGTVDPRLRFLLD
ncbi:YciI family protein [Luteimonas saliphila]|uniref:YciI family protein n=1 Tax=Luteimonas saliphila TaxID=2804919 RepID=UPI00192E1EB1|nr:YciI family protein [Luteimonas saliphila]